MKRQIVIGCWVVFVLVLKLGLFFNISEITEILHYANVAGVVPHLCGGSLELHQIYDSPVTPSPSAQFSLPQVLISE